MVKEKEQIDNLKFEREEETKGNFLIAGMDEVGRGPLAGPVCVACVMMPLDDIIEGIDDSKKLSAVRREEMYNCIMEHAVYVGIGQATPEEIDKINILNATKLAMERAAANAPATLCIVDAVRDLYLPFPIMPIIKGDSTSYNVAAASIVAKVTRDRQMVEYAMQYPQYGFERNMGYGTAEHIAALKEYGATPLHRRSFIRNFVQEDAAE